jgi:2-aminoadipate transaminase
MNAKTGEHFSALARRLREPPISWLIRLALERRGLISLAAGLTDNATLPAAELERLARRILSRPATARAALQYGTTIGLPALRRHLLRYWRQQDGEAADAVAVGPDDVIVTTGSQQLLYLIAEVLCDPGDVVLVEDPTYFVYLGIVEALGVQAAGFSGLEALKGRLARLHRQGRLRRLKLLYLVTYFQNPTGHTWSLEEKREALEIARHYERAAGHPIYIVEDAAYRDLRFEGADVPSFKSLDGGNARVAYTNTLTKPFATGLKTGYGILPPPLMRAVLCSKGNHDFGSANFLQTLLARAFADGVYQRHLPRIAAAYRAKRDAMLAELGAAFPASARWKTPGGGLYVWVELERRVGTGLTSRLFKRALQAGVLYVPGEICYCADAAREVPRHCLRLSFGAPSTRQIRAGIRRLASALPVAG